MSVIVKNGNISRLLLKGGAEIVVEECCSMHTFDNQIVSLNLEKKDQILRAIEGR